MNDTAFRSMSKICSTFRSGRILLVGDAAHVMSPNCGFGLNTGVQDGLNLGWKLAEVIKDNAGPELLDTYEQERRPAALAAMEASRQNDDLFSTLDPAKRSRAFRKFAVSMTHYLKAGGSGYEVLMDPCEPNVAVHGAEPEFGPGPGGHLTSDIRLALADGQSCYLTTELANTAHNILIFIGDGGIEAEQLVQSAITFRTGLEEEVSLTVVARSIEGAAVRTALAHDQRCLLIDSDLMGHNRLGVVERCVMWVRADGRIGLRYDDADHLANLKDALCSAMPGLPIS